MLKINKWFFNIVLMVAAVLFILFLCSAIFFFWQNNVLLSYLIPSLIIVLNIAVFVLNHKTIKRAYIVFVSTLMCLCSILVFLINLGLVNGGVKNWWPMVGVFSSISLMIAGFYKYRKLYAGYLIPAVVLLIVGLWFSLFSWKIITIRFIDFVIIGGPLLLIMSFVILFIMFYYQKKNKMFLIKNDEYNQFEDDVYLPIDE